MVKIALLIADNRAIFTRNRRATFTREGAMEDITLEKEGTLETRYSQNNVILIMFIIK